ncbi:MAG: ABC transporter ATP-binding protein [Planctomycetes bacterium]|nr:ABC transporter ATP-binding protein [Planctomycetota bacterium]
MNVLELRRLTKYYGTQEGIVDLDLDVQAGELFGFLGPNGAGKTTTIRLLLGFLTPTRGSARVLGRDVVRETRELKREVGYLPGDLRLYSWMSARTGLNLFSRLREHDLLPHGLELAERFQLPLDVRVREMSRGMRQKLGLILCCAHRPKLLILDEPSSALDPLVQRTLREYLLERAHEGATVFFSSHTLSEVEDLCERVAILRRARLVQVETLDRLRQLAAREITLRFPHSVDVDAILVPGALTAVERRPGLLRGKVRGDVVAVTAWATKQLVTDITVAEPSLEGLFHEHYAS